jgi:hypothetical protein
MLGNYQVATKLVTSRVVLSSIELFIYIYTAMCFKRHVSEVVFPQQPIWNFVGNWLVEASWTLTSLDTNLLPIVTYMEQKQAFSSWYTHMCLSKRC